MRVLIMSIFTLVTILGYSQSGEKKVDSLIRFVYVVKTSSDQTLTNAYEINSKFYSKRYKQSTGCLLESGFNDLKRQVIEVFKKDNSISYKLKNKNRRVIICFMPQYSGNMADVWFAWEGSDPLFTEDEMEKLIVGLKKIKVSFRSKGGVISDTSFCHTLSLGIFPKDL